MTRNWLKLDQNWKLNFHFLFFFWKVKFDVQRLNCHWPFISMAIFNFMFTFLMWPRFKLNFHCFVAFCCYKVQPYKGERMKLQRCYRASLSWYFHVKITRQIVAIQNKGIHFIRFAYLWGSCTTFRRCQPGWNLSSQIDFFHVVFSRDMSADRRLWPSW